MLWSPERWEKMSIFQIQSHFTSCSSKVCLLKGFVIDLAESCAMYFVVFFRCISVFWVQTILSRKRHFQILESLFNLRTTESSKSSSNWMWCLFRKFDIIKFVSCGEFYNDQFHMFFMLSKLLTACFHKILDFLNLH